jgi:hypothetical protein
MTSELGSVECRVPSTGEYSLAVMQDAANALITLSRAV